MGKEDKRQLFNQEIRIVKRNRASKESPSMVYFQILGNGALGGPKSVFIFTDHNRYLFNCGEGTQKIYTEHTSHKSLGQLANIFITRKCWDNMGGLTGMCLSVRSSGGPDMTIHGPEGCLLLYESTKHFVALSHFEVKSHQVSDGIFEDNVMTARHVPLILDKPVVSPDPKYDGWVFNMTSTDIREGEKIEINQTVNSYIVTIKPKSAKLDVQKCIALGVKPGPLMGMLKSGKTVTLEDGRKVTPEQVLGVEQSPTTYLFVDCPSAEYIPQLLNEPLLQSDHKELAHLQGIFHFSPLSVVKDPKYVAWINSFHEETQNIMLNEKGSGYGAHDKILYNAKLNLIAPDLIRKVYPKEQLFEVNDYNEIKRPVIQASANMKIMVRPDMHNIIEVENDPLDGFDEILKESNIQKSIHQVHTDMKLALENPVSNLDYPKIHFLGTGSSVPNKYRNVSGILIEIQPEHFMMFDCGEDTLLQMHHHFGRKRTLEVLKNMKAIYISHLHADHHLGVVNLIIHRDKYFQEVGEEPTKLFFMGPARLANYLIVYHQHFEGILTNLQLIRNESFLASDLQAVAKNVGNSYISANHEISQEEKDDLLKEIKLKSILTCRAYHAPASFCVAVVTNDGYKIVYSGDTRPIDALIELGNKEQKTDLLIHESTLEHKMLEDCIDKKHTTFTEAVEVSNKMEAKQTIFTHFSQRYSKVPTFEEFEVDSAKNCAIAFDHMVVTPKTICSARKIYPAMEEMFEKDIYEVKMRESFNHKRVDQFVEASLNIEKEHEPVISKKKQRLNAEIEKQRQFRNEVLFAKNKES